MNKKLYPTLAFDSIKRNGQIYFPYILTCIFTVAMYYIIHSIYANDALESIRGGDVLKKMLFFGIQAIALFSAIFLFYTNSFLIKRRKKELGLYNILGMEKKHIARMMTFETIFISNIALIFGIIAGIILSKLMFLLLLKLLGFDVSIAFYIPLESIFSTFIIFISIFFATLLFNLTQVHISKPIELLRGGEFGEKEPKTKWIFVIISIITLGTGYTIAIVVEKPVDAIGIFFIAVILVIIGTYSLFTAVTIGILKMLKKNKNIYYSAKYFVAISGMIYRMKQNAIGLANICILSTAVLVILSATISLYSGLDNILKKRYPVDASIIYMGNSNEIESLIDKAVDDELKSYGLNLKDDVKYKCSAFSASKDKDTFYLDSANLYSTIYLIDLDVYNKIENKEVSLDNDEILIYSNSIDRDYGYSEFNILNKQFKVKYELSELKIESKSEYIGLDSYYVILNDIKSITDVIDNQVYVTDRYYYKFNLDTQNKALKADFIGSLSKHFENLSIVLDNPFQAKESFLATHGSLLFIAIMFGSLFLMATVLIIYYKQISEGIEDRKRFEIMQYVGMSKMEIKKSIQSQIVIVFFLPLIVAILHMTVAFGVIKKLLMLFGLFNTDLFVICTIVTISIFAIIYFIVYWLTARVYYRIVN